MKNVVRFISTKKIFIIAGIILVTVLYILISHKDSPATSASNASKKYYKCITIEEGDTLWDIANEYKTEEYASTQDYIDEVLVMNNLNTDGVTVQRGMRRLPFPQSEYNTNNANVKAAVSMLGGADNSATDLWWAKKN